MKTKMKWIRIAALVLTAVMLCMTLVSCGGNKVDDASGTSGTLSWTYDSDSKTLTITGVGAMAEFENSEEVDWISVSAGVQRVVINQGVTTVSDYAFYGMSAITEVNLPETLTSIGDFAFAYCQKLETVSIPESVTSIGEGAFEACGALEAILVPSSVTELGDRAFAFCYSMTSAVIVGTPEKIGAWTFKNCGKLSNLVLSNQLTEEAVDETAFEDAAKNFDSAEKSTKPSGESTITIEYVKDGETIELIEDTKKYGEEYYYKTASIEGYTPDQESVSGTASGADRYVKVTYTEDPKEEVEEEVEEREPQSKGAIIAGIAIFVVVLAAIGVGAFFLMRSDKKGKKGTTVRKNNAPKNQKKSKKK